MTNPRQFRDPLWVIITRRMPRPLPAIIQAVQRAPNGLARHPVATSSRQLQRERGATPPRAAPAISCRGALQQREQRPLPTPQYGRHRGVRGIAPAVSHLPASVSRDGSINARPRAEQERSNLRRRAPRGAQQQDVESKQVAIAGLPQLAEHPLLFFSRNLKYRFSGHRRFFSGHQFGGTYRCIRKNLPVPISCGSI